MEKIDEFAVIGEGEIFLGGEEECLEALVIGEVEEGDSEDLEMARPCNPTGEGSTKNNTTAPEVRERTIPTIYVMGENNGNKRRIPYSEIPNPEYFDNTIRPLK